MSGNQRDPGGSFRQRLDDVLRRRDAVQLRAFLVAEGQWKSDAQTDEEAAMWMMIAASPVLADLHADAERWLMAHGHEHEAQAILGRHPVVTGRARESRSTPAGERARRGKSARGTGAGAEGQRPPRPARGRHPRGQSGDRDQPRRKN